MRIIKRGTLTIKEKFNVTPLIITCKYCGTIAEFKPNEIMSYLWRDSFGCGKICGKKEWVVCPVCGKDIILHEYSTK